MFDRLTTLVKRRRWQIAAVGCTFALLGAIYVGSFFACRQHLSVMLSTDPSSNPELIARSTFVVVYFSEDPATNRGLFLLFWPIHCWLGSSAETLSETLTDYRWQTIYVRDPTCLKEFGLL